MQQGVLVDSLERKNAFMTDNTIESLKHIIEKFISISDLSRGKASKVIQDVVKDESQYIIIKNNKPEAVILSLNEYMHLVEIKEKMNEMKEDIELIRLVNERMKNYDIENTMSQDEILKRYNIKEEEIDELIDFVELE
ncbi:prevent-host-death family protein [Proteiniborus sp. DW1]|uniref:type II toxin-antitoxin system Phd/YefM family antitoxin n=1 Tax=Proteiniborus sp. DW1 TaxID=1889883 RepID=UPI00092DEBF3|nr:type II toxin-antitoxin system Phd/YefM family antitoxin [Proteiniborus sp. DW1]SCG82853.1 prevent-host-death family protein [Proteiniborus sp. DW1]